MKRHTKVTMLTLAVVAIAGCTQSDKAAIRAMRFDSPHWKKDAGPDAGARKVGTPQILPKTHLAAARLLERQGKISDAIVQYRKAIVLNHNYVDAYHHLGVLLLRVGKRAEAVGVLSRAVELHPDNALLRNNLGFALMLMERWSQAEEQLVKATKLRPYFARAQVNLGMVYSRLGRFEDAFASFETVLPTIDAHYNLGLMYRGQRKYIEAAHEFNEILAINAEFAAASEQLQQISRHLPPAPEPEAVAMVDGADTPDETAVRPAPRTPSRNGLTVMHPRTDVTPAAKTNTVRKPKTRPAANTPVIAPPEIHYSSPQADAFPCDEEDEFFAETVVDDTPIASDEIDLIVSEADDVVPVRVVTKKTARPTAPPTRPTKAARVTTPPEKTPARTTPKAPRLETYEEQIVAGYDPQCSELYDMFVLLPSGDIGPLRGEDFSSPADQINASPAELPIASEAYDDEPFFVIDPAIPLVEQGSGTVVASTASQAPRPGPVAVSPQALQPMGPDEPVHRVATRTPATGMLPIDWLANFEELSRMLPDQFGAEPCTVDEPLTLTEAMALLEPTGILGPPTPYRFVIDHMDLVSEGDVEPIVVEPTKAATKPIRPRTFRDLVSDLRDMHAELITVRSEIVCWDRMATDYEVPTNTVSFADPGQAVLASYTDEVRTIRPISTRTQREAVVRTKAAPTKTKPERRPTMAAKVKPDEKKTKKTDKVKRKPAPPADVPKRQPQFHQMSRRDVGVNDLLDLLSITSNEMACFRAAEFESMPPQSVINWSEADFSPNRIASEADYDATSKDDKTRKPKRRRFKENRRRRPIPPTRR